MTLSTSTCAHARVRWKRRANARRAQSDVREREGVDRGRPAGRRAAATEKRRRLRSKAKRGSKAGPGRRSKPMRSRPCKGRSATAGRHHLPAPRSGQGRLASGRHDRAHPRHPARARGCLGQRPPGGARSPCTAPPRRQPCPAPGWWRRAVAQEEAGRKL